MVFPSIVFQIIISEKILKYFDKNTHFRFMGLIRKSIMRWTKRGLLLQIDVKYKNEL